MHACDSQTIALVIEVTIVVMGAAYDEYSGFVGLLVIIRLPWRIVRVVHAVIVMGEKVHHAAEVSRRQLHVM